MMTYMTALEQRQAINKIKDGCTQQEAIEILTDLIEYYVRRFPSEYVEHPLPSYEETDTDN